MRIGGKYGGFIVYINGRKCYRLCKVLYLKEIIVVVVFCVAKSKRNKSCRKFQTGNIHQSDSTGGGLFDIEHAGTVNYGERGVSGI